MIRVQYQDSLSASHRGTGLYGTAEVCPQGVTIYLVPGLTGRQRKAVLRRLRQEASRGCGPELPLPGLLIALAADRVRVAVKLTAAAVRLHPAITLVPAVLVALGTVLVLASAGVRPGLAAGGNGAGAGYTAPAVRAWSTDGDASAGFDSATVDFGPGRGQGGVGGLGAGGVDVHGVGAGGVGAGGRGLVAGQRRLTTGRVRPRTARVCFGAMPGMAAQRSQLACRQTKPSAGRAVHPDTRRAAG